MAIRDSISSSGAHSGRSGMKMLVTRIQAMRPDASGAKARMWLRLHQALGADADGIEVTSAGGYLELRGTVASREVAAHAHEIANGVGARGVLDFLRVR